jgi:hypothetical protein
VESFLLADPDEAYILSAKEIPLVMPFNNESPFFFPGVDGVTGSGTIIGAGFFTFSILQLLSISGGKKSFGASY